MKNNNMNELDLSWGNPDFLTPYWNNVDLSISSELPTRYKLGGQEDLKDLIIDLHKQEKNANITDKHIVIGNGATQILTGLMSILNKPVIADAPYFSRFPLMADNAGVPWKLCPKGIQIITTPNNPTNEIYLKDALLTSIYDLSYNWNQYTRPIKYKEDMMVFSLAKATGHASTRIGWAIIKDIGLANKLEFYVETTTGGISIESQTKASKIIEHQLNTKETCFLEGKKILEERHKILNSMKLPFKKLNNTGMFLWTENNKWPNDLRHMNIKVTGGEDMGDKSWYSRINLGCSESDFQEFIKRISNV